MPEWEAVIGLEVHAQLLTDSKIFTVIHNAMNLLVSLSF